MWKRGTAVVQHEATLPSSGFQLLYQHRRHRRGTGGGGWLWMGRNVKNFLRLNRKVCKPMPSGEDAQIKLVTVCNDTVHQRVKTGRRNRKCKRGCSDSNLQPSSLPFWYIQVVCLFLLQQKIQYSRDKRLVCRCLSVTVDGFDYYVFINVLFQTALWCILLFSNGACCCVFFISFWWDGCPGSCNHPLHVQPFRDYQMYISIYLSFFFFVNISLYFCG